MKRLKIGLLPIAALLGIMLTAATKADLPKSKKKAARAFQCDPSNPNDYCSMNFEGLIFYNSAAGCTGQFTDCPLFILGTPVSHPTTGVDCSAGTNYFCCLKIISGTPNVLCKGTL
ncbi:hypothetical protein SAMN04488505_1021031 [Chitinophaga rupis]|uniref:Uncharacterized protein n=1 Tax=Chitinophaga rupis TaxID=573321 RepID=A0A1H7STF6_9BACT|nr:hypothetical protein [Chitinophaga rupis]SEL75675.1 hypothetical protein SAMN04488505_1021031 [Chitinophaga rupis]